MQKLLTSDRLLDFIAQYHHIIHQEFNGPHEWWNMHPVHPKDHQGGIHGSGSTLNKIIKEVKK